MRVLVNLGKKHGIWNRQSRVLGHAIRTILEAQTRVNQLYLRMFKVPHLYEAGIVYREEPPGGVEEFATIPVIYERGWGDCDDLAPALAAFYREAGQPAKIRLKWRMNPSKGKRLYHVVVRLADGREEDPSARLGMYG